VGNSERLTILFAVLPETGHYTGTFRLARALRTRGHRIVYLGFADFESLVKEQGFEFVPFAEELLSRGYMSEFVACQADTPGLVARLRRRPADEKLFREYLHLINDGNLDACLLSCRPDLLVCDAFVWYIALRALKSGIPTISITITISLYGNTRIPPIISSIFPRKAWWYRFQVAGIWTWLRIKFFFTKRLASILFGEFRYPSRMHHLIDEFASIASKSGYRLIENKSYWFGEIGPRLALPEIVLCPEAFQLPGCPATHRRYMGDFVDVDRYEEPLPPGSLDETKPLVVCSLGTAAYFYPHAGRFFRTVFAASQLRPDWQFVLYLGNFRGKETFAEPSSNLFVCKRLPQLTLLRKAKAMVTHGGTNSIMECVQFGVPMVIMPAIRDQPGNATRAVYHDLALPASMAKVTPEQLVALIARVMEDRRIRQGLARMKQAIASENGLERCVQFVEEQMNKGKPEQIRSPVSGVRTI